MDVLPASNFLAASAFVLAQLVAGATGAASSSAASETKPPWKWTLEERLAQRFDPQASIERDAGAIALPGWHGLVSRDVELISGSLDPELLLPCELWDALASGLQFRLNSDPRTLPPAGFEAKAAALGFSLEFLDRLLRDIAPLSAFDTGEDDQEPQPLKVAAQESRGLRWCRLSRETRERAYRELGEGEVLRFLYAAVAPTITLGNGDREALERREAGCVE